MQPIVSITGRSGAGKTTLAALIYSKHYEKTGTRIECVGISKELRKHGDITHGSDGLDPREPLVRSIVQEAVRLPVPIILDGFPRNVPQAAWLMANSGPRLIFIHIKNSDARANLVARDGHDPERLSRAIAAAERQEKNGQALASLIQDVARFEGVRLMELNHSNDMTDMENMAMDVIGLLRTATPVVEVIGGDNNLVSGYDTDAGFDLRANLERRPTIVRAGQRVWVPTGVRINIPAGYAARIVSRSSTYAKLGLEVYEGLIDAGYTGELKIALINRTHEDVTLDDGQRLAQIVFFPVIRPALVKVREFTPSERGNNGFGSTGI